MTSSFVENRRKYSRISAGFHVAYDLDGDIVTTTTENISFGGMRITTPRLTIGKVLDFIITLKGEPHEVRGRVVYISRDRIHAGIKFEKLLFSEWERSPESLDQIPIDTSYISEGIQV